MQNNEISGFSKADPNSDEDYLNPLHAQYSPYDQLKKKIRHQLSVLFSSEIGSDVNQHPSEEFLRCMISDPYFHDAMPWDTVVYALPLSERFLDDFYWSIKNDGVLSIVYQRQNLSEDFLERHMRDIADDRNIGSLISLCQQLSESFIDKYSQYLSWKNISAFQNMSLRFLLAHQNEIDWEAYTGRNDIGDDAVNSIIASIDRIHLAKFNFDHISWTYELTEKNIWDNIEKINFYSTKLNHRKFKNKDIVAYRLLEFGF